MIVVYFLNIGFHLISKSRFGEFLSAASLEFRFAKAEPVSDNKWLRCKKLGQSVRFPRSYRH